MHGQWFRGYSPCGIPAKNGDNMMPTKPSPGRIVGVFLSVVLTLGGCRGDLPRGDSSIVVEVAISPTPPGVGPARLIISVQDTLGLPLEGAEVLVEGNMSHAGMTPVFDTAVAQAGGGYSVPDFTFTMAGDWILTVTVTLVDGRKAVVRKATGVVAAPPGFSGPGARGEGGTGARSHSSDLPHSPSSGTVGSGP